MTVNNQGNTVQKSSAQNITVRLSLPKLLLQAEGLVILIAATVAYGMTGVGPWWLYIVLLLAPDMFMLGYVANPRIGAVIYNVGHTLIVALAFAGIGVLAGWQTGIAIGLISLAHIGMDRTMGYGLKYAEGFKNTHLARV